MAGGMSTAGTNHLSLQIRSNPSHGTVELIVIEAEKDFEVYNSTGVTVLDGQYDGHILDLSNQPAGAYLIRVLDNAEVKAKRLIIR